MGGIFSILLYDSKLGDLEIQLGFKEEKESKKVTEKKRWIIAAILIVLAGTMSWLLINNLAIAILQGTYFGITYLFINRIKDKRDKNRKAKKKG